MDELRKALSEQRMNGAEKDVVDVLARTLGLTPAAVRRVIYAYEVYRDATAHIEADLATPGTTDPYWEPVLPEELRQALRLAVHKGVRRLTVRYAIEHSKTLSVDVKYLIPDPAEAVRRICDGCPDRLRCVAEDMSTPDLCVTRDRQRLPVFPRRLLNQGTQEYVEVEAQQPAGTYTVPLKAVLDGLNNVRDL